MAVKPWSVAVHACVVCVVACSDGSPGAERTTPSAGSSSTGGVPLEGGAPAQEAVSVYAVIDLPRTAATHTLSAITSNGQTFFAVPDKRTRLVTLTPNADLTEVVVGDGPVLSGESTADWDGEGLVHAADGSFYVVANETTPRIVHVTATGEPLGSVALPPKFADQPRNNKGLESLSLSPSGAFLFSCNEAALGRDGPPPTKTAGTAVRILRLPLAGRAAATEYAYRTEPLGEGSGGDMGVAEVLALSDESMLVLERGYQSDFGNTVRLFKVNLSGALDVSQMDTLGDAPKVVEKELLVDVVKLPPGTTQHPSKQPNPLLDNYEGMALGPTLADGRRLLLLLSDDNGQATQVARILVLAVRSL